MALVLTAAERVARAAAGEFRQSRLRQRFTRRTPCFPRSQRSISRELILNWGDAL
jgi:hypothetical protein